uniref:Uncharacterized protein n=1 Tax=Arundo donax TaxID=35708 RepID=A0A0A8YR86_ARUDO
MQAPRATGIISKHFQWLISVNKMLHRDLIINS